MSTGRYTAEDYFPEKPHLGYKGEVGDLRGDVERAFVRVATDMDGGAHSLSDAAIAIMVRIQRLDAQLASDLSDLDDTASAIAAGEAAALADAMTAVMVRIQRLDVRLTDDLAASDAAALTTAVEEAAELADTMAAVMTRVQRLDNRLTSGLAVTDAAALTVAADEAASLANTTSAMMTRIQRVDNRLMDLEPTSSVEGTAATTDAVTPGTVDLVTVEDGEAVMVDVLAIGRYDDLSEVGTYRITAAAVRDDAGAGLVLTTPDVVESESAGIGGTMTAVVAAATNTLQFSGTGVAATNISWKVWAQVRAL